MKKPRNILLMIMAVFTFTVLLPVSNNNVIASAAARNDFEVTIVSPQNIEEIPIYKCDVKVAIKNLTDNELKNLTCYLIVVDTVKNLSLPMDEFGPQAYKIIAVESIPAGETAEVIIPLKIMYTGTFVFTSTVINEDMTCIVTSNALHARLLAISSMNKTAVLTVAIIMPAALAAVTIFLTKGKNRQKKIGLMELKKMGFDYSRFFYYNDNEFFVNNLILGVFIWIILR